MNKIQYLSLFYIYIYIFILTNITNKNDHSDLILIKTIPEVAIVIMSCMESNNEAIDPTLFNLPYHIIKCNPKTNVIDCHEAVPYLNFIVDNYDAPAAKKFIFIHGHNTSWHYTQSVYSIVKNLLNTKEFYTMNYGSINHFFYQKRVFWVQSPKYRKAYYNVFHDTPLMEFFNVDHIWFPCCASFFVDSRQFKIRPKQLYIDMIKRLRWYSILDRKNFSLLTCGRLLEYTWHIIFTNKAIMPDKSYHFIDSGKLWSPAPIFHP